MARQISCIFFLISLSMPAWAKPALYAPASGSIVLGSSLVVDLRGCQKPAADFRARLDGAPIQLTWARGPYKNQWIAELRLPDTGAHELKLEGRHGITTRFVSRESGTLDVARSLAAHFIKRNMATKLGWNWGPAVFLYGLFKADPQSPYLRDYYAYWDAKGIAAPDKSDACPAALAGLGLARSLGETSGLAAASTVAHYIATEPRNRLGALNHLGHSFLANFFPDSIWVDSLMMYGVFAAQWGNFAHDGTMLEFAADQPLLFASVLQDSRSGLFRHAWLVKQDRPLPKTETYWLRGNGWVVAAIAEILDEIPPGSPQREPLLGVFRRAIEGLKAHQQATGLWDSILNLPGYSYGETSGSALVAYAIAKGVHRGWLPASDLAYAKRAFASVTARLNLKNDGYSMPRISWSTNPGPRWLYRLVPALSDLPYGVGAYLMAAAELANDQF